MSLGAITRDQAKKIAQAIFDDVEMSGLFSLDRVTDVIERMARMERQQDEELDRKIAELYQRHRLNEIPGPFGGTIVATTPELAKKASQLLDFCKTPKQTIIQPDD